MPDFIALASTGVAFFIVAVSPGPATLSNATIAMNHGRRASLIYGLGLSVGLVFWGLIAASGLGAVLHGSLWVLPALKILGGAYLLWLALQSGRSAMRPATRKQLSVRGHSWFLRGLALNLSNPKSVIAWIAALSVGLGQEADTASIIAVTSICIAVGFATNALYSLLFSIRGMMCAYARARRVIDSIVAGLFAVAGFGLIRSAFAR